MARLTDIHNSRARVVEAAWQVVAEEGIEAATMRRIAARAGCTTGFVTYYFTNKEDVLKSVVEHAAERSQKRRSRARSDKFGLDAALAIVMSAVPSGDGAEAESEWRVWISLWNHSILSPVFSEVWARRSESWLDLIRDALMDAVAAGDLRDDAPIDLLSRSFAAMAWGISVTLMLTPGVITDAQARMLVENHFRQSVQPHLLDSAAAVKHG